MHRAGTELAIGISFTVLLNFLGTRLLLVFWAGNALLTQRILAGN
jgi:hypothetical protein